LPPKLNYTILWIAVHFLEYTNSPTATLQQFTTVTTCCAWSHPQEVLKGCPGGLIGWLVG